MIDGMTGTEIRGVPFAPHYFVTDDGRVFSSHRRGRRNGNRDPVFQLTHQHDRGYPKVDISVGSKTIRMGVHRLVIAAFRGGPPGPGYEVRHMDGNQSNPRLSNLEYGTKKDNASDRERHGRTYRGERNGFSRLTEEQVVYVLAEIEPYVRGVYRRLARELGVDRSTIQLIAQGKIWTHVTAQRKEGA